MKLKMLRLIAPIAFFTLGFSAVAEAQQAIGAKSGVIQYATGKREMLLDGAPIKLAENNSIQMENDQILSTKQDWIELGLTPAAYLWLGEKASLKMLNNQLNNIQLEINQGSASIKIVRAIEACPINVHISKSVINIKKAGFYRFDANPGNLRVYSGEALLKNDENILLIMKGSMIRLDGRSTPEKFRINSKDALDKFAINRSSDIADWMNQKQKEAEEREKHQHQLEELSINWFCCRKFGGMFSRLNGSKYPRCNAGSA